MDKEIEIYIHKLKKFLESSPQQREYFIGEQDIDGFLDLVKNRSFENYKESGDPALTKEQFEKIRVVYSSIKDMNSPHIVDLKKITQKIGNGFGFLYLN